MSVYINAAVRYDPHDFKRLPFLRKDADGKIMNGNFDVTDVPKRLAGIRTGGEELRLKDYLVYRPLPKALLKLSEKPDVHPQSYDMQMYYAKLTDAITNGVTVGGEYYNPFFMMWILLFRFEIPVYDKKGNLMEGFEVGKPLYSTVDRYIFDYMWKAYKTRQYGAFMAGRGIGKSYITDCIMAWYYMMFDGQEMIVSATSEPIVEEAWSKFVDTIDVIEDEYPGFNQKRITDSVIKVLAGEEYYDSLGDKKKRGSLNEVRRIIYGDNPNVTRGRRPHFQHIEEFASFPAHPSKGSLKNCLGQSKGSWIVQGSIKKAFVIMTGTGGSVNNKDAEDIFTKPRGSNILPTNEWGKETGLFIPTYLKYGGTWEHTGVPDIELALTMVVEARKLLESDPVLYAQELQEFPITLEEVFITKGVNNFNQDKISEMISKIKSAKEKPWKEGRLDYILDSDGNVTGVKFEEIAGGDIIIVEMPDKVDGQVLKNLYVGGVDGIDQGKNDSLVEGSKLACTIKKRRSDNMFSKTSDIYVAYYNKRSDNVLWDYEAVLKLSIFYNAKINLEYTKINMVSFFRQKKQLWRLMKRPSIAIGANVSGQKASMLIGTPATPAVIVHQDQKLAAYIDESYYHILYLPALEQLRDYDANNRTKFDFVVSMGLTELADEDLLGKPASENGTAGSELEPFGMYRDANGKKHWGVIPKDRGKEIESIALEESEQEDQKPFRWVESTDI